MHSMSRYGWCGEGSDVSGVHGSRGVANHPHRQAGQQSSRSRACACGSLQTLAALVVVQCFKAPMRRVAARQGAILNARSSMHPPVQTGPGAYRVFSTSERFCVTLRPCSGDVTRRLASPVRNALCPEMAQVGIPLTWREHARSRTPEHRSQVVPGARCRRCGPTSKQVTLSQVAKSVGRNSQTQRIRVRQ